jgi:hypothetical protein
MASRGVGGMNGRASARARTAGGKMDGNTLLSRSSDCLFLAAFCSSHLDMSGPIDEAMVHQTRKVFVTIWANQTLVELGPKSHLESP